MLLLLSQSLFWNIFQLAIRVFTIIAQFIQDMEYRLQNANKILVLLKAEIQGNKLGLSYAKLSQSWS